MLTLADRLIETALDKRWPRALRQDFEYVAAQIKGAQRFIVSDDVRKAIRALLTSRPTTLVAASKYARLPYERCWFEWKPPGYENLKPNQIQVKRCGALLEAYGPHGYTIFTAWEFDREEVQKDVDRYRARPGLEDFDFDMPLFGVSSVVGAYDLSSFDQPPLMLGDQKSGWFAHRANTDEELAQQRDDHKNSIGHALKDPIEREALRQLELRSAFRIHGETHGFDKINSQIRLTNNAASIIHDVQDEMGHLFATLILMNAKNCVEIAKTEPPEKLNKARRKQGKVELLPYSTVHIELSQSQKRAVADGRISREEARRHLVRGHFKVRATGVFWWGEAWRGNAARGIVERRAHIVEASHSIAASEGS
jgi:hypothetical protein